MKGAAGTLGATDVQQKAAALEAAIRDDLAAETIEPLLAECAESYRQLCAELDAILEKPASPPNDAASNVVDSATQTALLSEFRVQLRSGDIVCLSLLNQNSGLLRDMLGKEFKAFETAVNAFDFESALTILDRLK